MKKFKNIEIRILGVVLFLALIAGCTADYPYPDPGAAFEVWGIHPVTKGYEQVVEPYVLFEDIYYDYIVEGEGHQFVFWFGVPGDTASRFPKGSDFNDRGVNQLSRGAVALNNKAKFKYTEPGTYTLVFVASSYSYFDREYKEATIEKEVQVIELPAEE